MRWVLAPPAWGDVAGMIAYVLGDPYLFIGSTTVMTAGLIAASGVLGAATLAGGFAAGLGGPAERALDWLAPKLALVLAYFGIGSMALATEILIRFGEDIPYETATQFRSGIGHLIIAAAGVLLLRGRLRGLSARCWAEANFWALAYFTVHVQVLTPPWFEFQGQLELVLATTRALLAGALAANLALWWRLGGPGLTSSRPLRRLLPHPKSRRH